MMTPEEKKLLLKDICARLPYNVKIHIGKTQRIEVFDDINIRIGSINNTYADIRPYLFPQSSMTEEQKEEYESECNKDLKALSKAIRNRTYTAIRISTPLYYGIDWLNAHHFDYRGLIEKGLALNATDLNIY